MIMRSIGYLARLLIDEGRGEKAQAAVDCLRGKSREPSSRIALGLATALGFLGQLQPILECLESDRPWVAKVARNIFDDWASWNERIKAVGWSRGELKANNQLAPDVRSSLEGLIDEVGRRIGVTIPLDGELPEVVRDRLDEMAKLDELDNAFRRAPLSTFPNVVAGLMSGPGVSSREISVLSGESCANGR